MDVNTIKALRDKTGAGIADCRTALEEANGNIEAAAVVLRKKGMDISDKKRGRVTAEGIVDAYIHNGGKIGVLVEVNCESDFVARSDEFRTLVRDIGMHIAAQKPLVVSREDLTPQQIETEKASIVAQLQEDPKNAKKPPNIIEKIVTGRLDNFYADQVLLDQPFVKDGTITVGELIKSKIGLIKENITVRRFSYFRMGEGIVRQVTNFADEVNSIANGT